MGRTTNYTVVTALDANIPRQLALDLLHSHEEIISLNPLVINVQKIETPQTAAADEYFAQWYEVTEKITFLPGFKKTIKFKSCWYDQPWGGQTHTAMPSLFDMRCSYRVGGNQPGEPRETAELGVDKPAEGLYLREDIQIDLHIPVPASFVKKEMQRASATMIARLKRKAELLDEGRLLALFEDGKLKTTKAATMTMLDTPASPSVQSFGNSFQRSPTMASETFSAAPGRYSEVNYRRSVHRQSGQQQNTQPRYPGGGANPNAPPPIAELDPGPNAPSNPAFRYDNPDSFGAVAELGGSSPPPARTFAVELDASAEAAPKQRPTSQSVSTGVGSQDGSSTGTPQLRSSGFNNVPPANNPNAYGVVTQ